MTEVPGWCQTPGYAVLVALGSLLEPELEVAQTCDRVDKSALIVEADAGVDQA
jgi:hypothetical protein